MDNITWNNLQKIVKKIRHGTLKIKIENGQPVFIPQQTILRDKIEGIIEQKTIDDGIDLTKDMK